MDIINTLFLYFERNLLDQNVNMWARDPLLPHKRASILGLGLWINLGEKKRKTCIFVKENDNEIGENICDKKKILYLNNEKEKKRERKTQERKLKDHKIRK